MNRLVQEILHDLGVRAPARPLPVPPRPCSLTTRPAPPPGNNSSHGDATGGGSGTNDTNTWSSGRRVGTGRRNPRADDDSPAASPPRSRLTAQARGGGGSREGEEAGALTPPALVFGPVHNPSRARKPDDGDGEEEGEEEDDGEDGFFCRVCGERVKSLPREKHNTSTLHIFNQEHRPQERKVGRNIRACSSYAPSHHHRRFLKFSCTGTFFCPQV